MIAKSEAIAEEGCRRLKVDYEILPHVVDSAAAIAPGAPLIHPDKMPEHRVVNSARNIVAESHGEYGDVAAALSASAITWEGTFTTQRVQHAALETHGGFAFIDGEGVLTVRSSTQVPFLIDTVPPAGHIGDCYIALREDGGFTLTVGTAEFGNGTSTVHRQIAATALATTVDQIELKQSDTAHGGHDTGAYILGVMHFEKVVAAPRGDIVIPFRLGVPQFTGIEIGRATL